MRIFYRHLCFLEPNNLQSRVHHTRTKYKTDKNKQIIWSSLISHSASVGTCISIMLARIVHSGLRIVVFME